VEGDWLRIGPGGNIAVPWYGRYELLRIRSIAGNIITLEWEVQDQYLTTTPAGILKFDPPHDIILDFGNAHFSGDVFGRTREIVINSALDVTINGGHWDESAGGLQTFVLTFAYAATRCQASKTHVINHKCALFGTVDLTTLSYPADFGTKTLSIKCDATTTVVTFANPASPIAAIAEINAALGVLGNASLGSGNILLVVADNDVVVTDGTLLAATVGMTSTAHGQVAGWLLLEGGKTCTIDKSVLDGPSLQVEVCFEATITEPHIVSRDPIYSALVLRDPDQVTINGGHCESAGRGHGVELPNNPTTTVVIRGTRMIGAPVSGTAGLWGFGRVCHVSIFGVEAIGYSYGVNIGTGAPNQNQMFYAEDTVAETIDVNGYCWYSQAPEVTKAHLVRCTARRLGGAPGFVGFAGAMLVEEPTVNNLTIGFGTAAGQKMIVRRISSTSSVVDYWFLIAQTIIVQDSNIVANGATVAFKGWNTPNLLDLQNVIVTGTGVGISGTLFGVVTRIDGQSAILTSTVENGTPTQWSRGNATPYSASIFTGTGAPAAVAFSDLRAGEAPKFTALTGAGVMPLIALTPGTGFTANAPLGTTYVWEM
jgi:hypothetical protein